MDKFQTILKLTASATVLRLHGESIKLYVDSDGQPYRINGFTKRNLCRVEVKVDDESLERLAESLDKVKRQLAK